nr:hypothetical protein [Tanacetum cinerariifolium]
MYVDDHVDIFDMVDIDLFTVVALNMMVVQLGYTGKSEPMFYNYLRPLASLDEGLYALACEEDISFLATLVRSFKLIEVYIEHGLTAVDSYNRPSPLVREPICDSITPRSLPQHDFSTPCKDSICESITPRCMPHCMLTPPSDKYVITYTQLSGVQGVDIQDHVFPPVHSQFSDINPSFISQQATASQVIEDVMRQLSFEETKLDYEAGFGDVARSDVGRTQEPIVEEVKTQEPIIEEVRTHKPIIEEVDESAPSDEHFFYDDEGIDSAYETQYDVQSSEDACTYNDDDFLVDEENKIVKPDVDVHLFGINMDVPFDKIGVTNLVLDDVLEGYDVDVINLDGFDSDLGNDNETSNYRRRSTTKKAKERVYLHSIESGRNLKLYKNDSVRVRARCNGKVLVFTMSQVERNNDPSLPTRVFHRIYVWLGASKLGFRACRRELLGLDGAFKNGPFPGQVLAVVGLDSNNKIYPLAYALVEAKSSWCWFLQGLGDDIDLHPYLNFSFINDR